jgi:hypothetical protein
MSASVKEGVNLTTPRVRLRLNFKVPTARENELAGASARHCGAEPCVRIGGARRVIPFVRRSDTLQELSQRQAARRREATGETKDRFKARIPVFK